MGFGHKTAGVRTPSSPLLFAAHVAFINPDYSSALTELAESLSVDRDSIEVLEVSLYERVFALWIRPDGYHSHEAIKTLIQRMESLYTVRKCVIQQHSIFFVNSADECVEVSCTSSDHLPCFKGVHYGEDMLKFYASREYDAWCFLCYDTQNPFKEFSCRTAQRFWKRSSDKEGSWVCTVNPEETIRKGSQQFTTLSKVLAEFGRPEQYFMLIPKAFDNTYPYLVHAEGQSVADPDVEQPPPFTYQIVSDPNIGPGYLSWEKICAVDYAETESSVCSEDFWVTETVSQKPMKRRHSLTFW